MRLAVVEVDVERPVQGEDPARLLQPRPEKAEVVGVRIVIGERLHDGRAVAAPAEAGAIAAVVVADGRQGGASLGPSRVERRVDGHHVEGAVGQLWEDVGAVALDQPGAGEDDRVAGAQEPHRLAKVRTWAGGWRRCWLRRSRWWWSRSSSCATPTRAGASCPPRCRRSPTSRRSGRASSATPQPGSRTSSTPRAPAGRGPPRRAPRAGARRSRRLRARRDWTPTRWRRSSSWRARAAPTPRRPTTSRAPRG